MLFKLLQEQRESLEQKIGAALEWEPLENRRAKRVALYYPEPISIADVPEKLEALRKWAVAQGLVFINVFRPVVKRLPPLPEPADSPGAEFIDPDELLKG